MTERDEFGNTDIIGVDSMDLQCNLEFDEFNKVTNALNKLAEYEELEERCCKENSWGLKMLTEKWKEFIEDIQELYEYRKAEEQNRLLKLPCAVGDTVYEVQDLRKRIQPYTIVAAHISNCGNLFGWELKDGKGVYSNVNGFSEYAIGKQVFLTREEAEAALKELEDRNA